MALATEIQSELAGILGPQGLVMDEERRAAHANDWSGTAGIMPAALLRPADTASLSAAMAVLHRAGIPVAVQGGRTGLVGGAAVRQGEVALSLERLSGVEAVDPLAATLTARAGTIVQAVQDAAEAAGLMYGVDFGARGSANIGGSIATNAGGIRVLRYGMTRAQVLGLEVVLADGTVLSDMGGLMKNNTGIDLKQLFVGTEGVLGIVTRAVLRLHPAPSERATAWLAIRDETDLTGVLAAARGTLGTELSAFEVMWPDYMNGISARSNQFRPAIEPEGRPAVLIEASGGAGVRERLEAFLASGLEAEWLADAVIAESGDQEKRLWAIRDEAPAEYPALFKATVPFDVSFALDRMIGSVVRLRTWFAERAPGAVPLFYGHLGDNNLHLVVGFDAPIDAAEKRRIETAVYEEVRAAGGSVSAEHGIGMLKRPWLAHTRSAAELATMRAIKRTLDPKDILNRGRVFGD